MATVRPLIDDPPPGGGWPGHPLFTLDNLYRAYRECRRRKRGTHSALVFERRLEENLLALRDELDAGTYQPGRFLAFLLETPKRREIFAAKFRDRVVHHLLVGHQQPAWERRFIHDSFACRHGKGTLAGVDRIRSFARRVTCNGSRRAWYLQLDIRGFFIALNRQMLYRRLAIREHDPAVRWLTRQILFHEPTEHCRFRGAPRAAFERLPAQRSLFHAREDCGLPIGNLTSQFWANVYLDALDQFVKHHLKVRFYVRYCDDLVLQSPDRGELEEWEHAIEAFLGEQLHLELNERRRLRPVSDGIDFLGFIVRPDYLLVRRRVVAALRQRLNQTERRLERAGLRVGADERAIYPRPPAIVGDIHQWLNSYLGYLRRASTHRLLGRLRTRYWWLAEYFAWRGWKVVPRYPPPRCALRFADQLAWFRSQLPGHVLAIQTGAVWKVACHPTMPDRPLLPPQAHPSPGDDTTIRRWRTAVAPRLWASGTPIAWIAETGRRPGVIAERILVSRWSGRAAPATDAARRDAESGNVRRA